MPLDPSIIAGGRPAPIQSPLEAISTIAQLQGIREQTEARRLAAEKARQQAMDDAAIRRVMTEAGGDWEKALPQLRTIAPSAAAKLETDIAETRNKTLEGLKTRHDLAIKQLGIGAQILETVNDQQSLDVALPMIATMSPEIAQQLGPTYDPARVAQFRQIGLTQKDLYERKQDAVKLLTEGKATEAMGTWLSTINPADPQAATQWDQAKAGARAMGVPAAVLAQFGDFSPEAPARAGQLAIAPAKRAELAGQAEARGQTAAHQAEQEAVARQQLGISAGHLAVARGQLDVARQRLAKGTGTEQDRDALMQAVVDNPGLWDQIPPTERGKIAGELNARGFTGFGKPLSDAALKQISETKSGIESLKDLREVVKKNEQYIGPIAGYQALYPWSAARQAQADIDRVRQRVGKALEGGVLRKEDEEKYKRILATLTDTPATAIYKIDQLSQDLQRDIDIYTHAQRLAGRRVPATSRHPPPPTLTGT